MDIVQTLKSVYFALEDRYYDSLDYVNQYVPVYKIVDPVDRVFPSFILLIVFFLLLGTTATYLIAFSPSIPLAGFLQVVDDNDTPLKNVSIVLNMDNNRMTLSTGSTGTVNIPLKNKLVNGTVSLNVANFEPLEDETVSFTAGSITKIRLTPKVAPPAQPIEIEFKDKDSENTIDDRRVNISFSCSQGNPPAQKFTTSGTVSVDVPASCGQLKAKEVSAQGYQTSRNVNINPADGKAQILLSVQEIALAEKGMLSVTVLDIAKVPVSNARAIVRDSFGTEVDSMLTNQAGIAVFSLETGTYKVSATKSDGRISDTNTATVEESKTVSTIVSLGPVPNDKKVMYKVLDANTNEPVSNAKVKLFFGSTLVTDTGTTNNSGIFEQPVLRTNVAYTMVIDHAEYVIRIVTPALLIAQTDDNAIIIQLDPLKETDDDPPKPENYAIVKVTVLDEDFKSVENAVVQLYRQNESISMWDGKTTRDGNVELSRIPAGRYHVIAHVEDINVDSGLFDLNKGDVKTLELNMLLAKRVFKITVLNAKDNSIKINRATIETYLWDEANARGVKVETGETNNNGEFETKRMRVGSKAYFTVARSDHLPFTSTLYTVPEGRETEKIELVFLVSKPEDIPTTNDANSYVQMQYLKIYDATDSREPAVLEAGKSYWAYFQMTLSEGDFVNTIGHVRAGPNSLLTAVENNIFIENAETHLIPHEIHFSSRTDIGNVFTNPDDVSDNNHAKQTNLQWELLHKGTYQFKVKFSVKEGLAKGTTVDLHYQLKSNTVKGTGFTEDQIKTFSIGEVTCTSNCPLLYWNLYIKQPIDADWTVLDLGAPPRLSAHQEYNIGFVIQNLSTTEYSTSALYSNPDHALQLGGTPAIDQLDGFQNELLPQRDITDFRSAPLTIKPNESIQGFLSIDLTTIPAVEAKDLKYLHKDMTFQIDGGAPMRIDAWYDGTAVVAMAYDSATNAQLTDVLFKFGRTNQGSIEAGITAPYGKTDTPADGIARYPVALNDGDTVIVEATKNGYQTSRTMVTSTIIIVLNPTITCIGLDMVSETSAVDEYRDALRPATFKVKVVGGDCRETYSVTMERPRFVTSSWLDMSPNSFEVGKNTVTEVTVTVGSVIPRGIIPIWAEGKPKGSSQEPQATAIGEVRITPTIVDPANNVCFGIGTRN